MIFYDGIYRLKRRKDHQSKDTGRLANAWRLRIINLSINRPEVKHLRPIIIIATLSEEGIFHTTCAESLGKKICRDFNLNVGDILWIEHFPKKPVKMYVAVFRPTAYSGHDVYYTIDWRPIRPNEVEAIRPFVPEADDIDMRSMS